MVSFGVDPGGFRAEDGWQQLVRGWGGCKGVNRWEHHSVLEWCLALCWDSAGTTDALGSG